MGMVGKVLLAVVVLTACWFRGGLAFTAVTSSRIRPALPLLQARGQNDDNKAMAFLRKIGKVGGHQDFTHVVGIDEGSAGKHAGKGAVRMAKQRDLHCTYCGSLT